MSEMMIPVDLGGHQADEAHGAGYSRCLDSEER
jgi:hypothetical protein